VGYGASKTDTLHPNAARLSVQMKRATLFSLVPLLAGSLVTREAHAQDPDPWWGQDKALHFGVSAGLAATSYAGFSLVLDGRAERAAAGAGLTITLGAAKEGWDATGHGDASFKDFTWDVAGAAVGTGLALLVDVLVSPRHETAPR
jgi:putative lipoprotein